MNQSYLVVNYLLAKGADIHQHDYQNMSCLHFLVYGINNSNFKQAMNCVQNLIFYGCNTNDTNIFN